MVVVVKKRGKKVEKSDIMEKKSPKFFFSVKEGIFHQKLHEESEKNGPDALQRVLV